MLALEKKLYYKKGVNTAKKGAEIMDKMITDYNKEHFFVIMLDARNRPIGVYVVSIGTLNACLVHPREVFKRAIQRNCASIIIGHNHPSGGTEPSEADIMLTGRITDAGKILGIELLDSIIFNKGLKNYQSII